MRQYSAKRAAQQRARRAVLQRDHGPQRCQWPWGCVFEAVDAHEALSRARGGDPADPDWLLCRLHHDKVTTPPPGMADVYAAAGLIRSASPLRSRNVNATVHPVPSPRKPIAIRVSQAADEFIGNLAVQSGVTRSVVVRAMLRVASQHQREVATAIRSIAEVDRHSSPTT